MSSNAKHTSLHYHSKTPIEIANESIIVFAMYHHSPRNNKSQGPLARPLIPSLDDMRRVRRYVLLLPLYDQSDHFFAHHSLTFSIDSSSIQSQPQDTNSLAHKYRCDPSTNPNLEPHRNVANLPPLSSTNRTIVPVPSTKRRDFLLRDLPARLVLRMPIVSSRRRCARICYLMGIAAGGISVCLPIRRMRG